MPMHMLTFTSSAFDCFDASMAACTAAFGAVCDAAAVVVVVVGVRVGVVVELVLYRGCV